MPEHKKRLCTVLGVVVLCIFGCDKNNGVMSIPATADLATRPEEVSDGWRVEGISQLGLNAELIEEMFRSIKRKEFVNIDGVVIAKSGYLVFEAYFNGYNRNKRHDLRSATKSITSALVGIAIDRGHIASVVDPVYAYLNDYSPFGSWNPEKEKIQIRHLLTMTPGWDCNDWVSHSRGNENNMYKEKDWVRFILDLPMTTPPGSTFGYCTGGVVTLGEVIKSGSGLLADEFAKRHLFEPLGITNYNWEYTPIGQVDTGGHIWMTPRDMAKLGQLFLQRGVWMGEQIISTAWVDDSTRFHLTADSQEYGYLWWRGKMLANGRSFHFYNARGNGGQYIFVVPSEELVVVFTGSNYNSSLADQPYTLLQKFILKALDP